MGVTQKIISGAVGAGGEKSFEMFRRLATSSGMSRAGRIGFQDDEREGRSEVIFGDIAQKLPALLEPRRSIIDIGPGCGELAEYLVSRAARLEQRLLLVDSEEMLSALPNSSQALRVSGEFPLNRAAVAAALPAADAILVYSVAHYIYRDRDLFRFVAECLALLAPRGRLLVGDIPNRSMQIRFFSSEAGRAYHRARHGSHVDPVIPAESEAGVIDDGVVIELVRQARASGVHASILPQAPELPFANRREDLLFERP